LLLWVIRSFVSHLLKVSESEINWRATFVCEFFLPKCSDESEDAITEPILTFLITVDTYTGLFRLCQFNDSCIYREDRLSFVWMQHSVVDITLCCEIFDGQNCKSVEITDNVKTDAETLLKPHMDRCVHIFLSTDTISFFWTLPTLLYPVPRNSKESTRLDASLPEDGSRAGFQNILFFWNKYKQWTK